MKKIKRYRKNKKGFSLLEMVIIMAIVSIMTSVMLVVTLSEKDTKEIEAAGREITAAIREAQNYALTGKQQGAGLPCSFGFFLPELNIDNVDTGSSRIEVRGSYRLIDGACGAENIRSTYTDAHRGRLFLEKDFSDTRIEIFGFTSLRITEGSGAHQTDFIAFGVPYGKFFDQESVNTPPSIGTEFVVRKMGDKENEYHICVHDTGLIETIGFVKRKDSNEDEIVSTACKF